MTGHQVVRMRPTGQRLDALEPGGDVLVRRWNIEAEFLGRIIEVGDERQVGDGRLRSENVGAAGEALVDNAERIVDTAFEEFHYRRMARRLGKIAQETIRPEKAV